MILRDLKFSLRSLFINRFYNLLNVAGLSASLALSIFLLTYYFHEKGVDRFHSKSDHIYLLRMDYMTNGEVTFSMYPPTPVYDMLKNEYAQIENTSRAYVIKKAVFHKENEMIRAGNLLRVDSSFFTMFDFPVLEGNHSVLFNSPASILISENIAKRYYHDQEPIGKIIRFSDDSEFTIGGIIKNPPSNSSIQFDFVCATNHQDSITWQFTTIPPTYFEVQKPEVAKSIAEALQVKIDNALGANNFRLELVPLSEQYLHGGIDFIQQGDNRYLSIYGGIALIILALAIINYINLSTAQSLRRTKEVGVKKILGANKFDLLKQHLLESTLLIVISLLLGTCLCYLLFNYFNALIGKTLLLNSFSMKEIIIFFLSLFITILVFSGVYPAWQLAGLRPLYAMKNAPVNSKTTFSWRQGLLIFQFAISTIFIVISLVIHAQVNFLTNQKLGFEKDQILSIKIDQGNRNTAFHYSSLKNEFLKLPTVTGVTISPMPLFDWETGGTFMQNGKEETTQLYIFGINEDFLEVMKIDLVAGRNFDNKFNPVEEVLINETAANLFFSGDPIGQENKKLSKRKIIGIVKDFHFLGNKEKVKPLVLAYSTNSFKNIQVKVKTGKIGETLEQIQSVWKKTMPERIFEYSFLDDDYYALYQEETRTSNAFSVFSLLSILIACLGLFGIATYTLQNKKKQLSIRKVCGATSTDILAFLSRSFLSPVAIAIFIALPIALWSSTTYLQTFTYRIKIASWFFILGGLITILLVISTIGYMCIKAARTNPVVNLKEE